MIGISEIPNIPREREREKRPVNVDLRYPKLPSNYLATRKPEGTLDRR